MESFEDLSITDHFRERVNVASEKELFLIIEELRITLVTMLRSQEDSSLLTPAEKWYYYQMNYAIGKTRKFGINPVDLEGNGTEEFRLWQSLWRLKLDTEF